MSVLDEIVKAYDIRGTVPDQLNAEVARALGVAFARYAHADEVLIGRDMRPSGPELVAAFTDGMLSQGVDVVDIGLASSDLVYFAAGHRDRPGVMFTASHNPAEYNGVKMCLEGARPVDTDGLGEIKAVASTVLDGHGPADAARSGTRREADLLPEFVDHVLSFVDIAALRPLRIVADTANGMGGLVVPAVFERLPQIELEVMYGELDGTFPNHPADPLQPANQRDLRARVLSGGFDVGLAFDGDADRVFVVDELGIGLSGSTTTSILAAAVLRSTPGGTILHNLICSRAVPEVIREHGGVPDEDQGRSLVHQEDHGRDRRRVRRGALRPLLLRPQLRGRQRTDRHDARHRRAQPVRPGAVDPAQAVRALHPERRDQHDRRRRRRGARRSSAPRWPIARRTTSTGCRSTAAPGGSTCAPPTPSRSCG